MQKHSTGISIYFVKDQDLGFSLAENILAAAVDKTTVLFLSGGKTPNALYRHIAESGLFHPGAVGLVDERFGPPFHKESNELMLEDTGLLDYCRHAGIPVYRCLRRGLTREKSSVNYDEQLGTLFATYQRHIAVLGIGLDGHTAGIPAQNLKVKSQKSKVYTTTDLVTEYNDTRGVYGERVTMTFTALSMMDLLLVLVFGKEKKHALDLLFANGSEEEVPSRFFKRPEIAKKTILITDQTI